MERARLATGTAILRRHRLGVLATAVAIFAVVLGVRAHSNADDLRAAAVAAAPAAHVELDERFLPPCRHAGYQVRPYAFHGAAATLVARGEPALPSVVRAALATDPDGQAREALLAIVHQLLWDGTKVDGAGAGFEVPSRETGRLIGDGRLRESNVSLAEGSASSTRHRTRYIAGYILAILDPALGARLGSWEAIERLIDWRGSEEKGPLYARAARGDAEAHRILSEGVPALREARDAIAAALRREAPLVSDVHEHHSLGRLGPDGVPVYLAGTVKTLNEPNPPALTDV